MRGFMITKKQAVTRYVIAFFIFIGGIAGFIAFLIFSIMDIADMKQYVVPGIHTLELEHPGKYTVFHEYRTMIDGEYFNSDEGFPAGMKIAVTSREGDTLSVNPLLTGGSYSIGSREGNGIAYFTITTPGTYQLEGRLSGDTASKAVLTVTSGFMSRLFITVFGGIFIVGITMLLSLFIAVQTLIKQLDQKKKGNSVFH